MPVKDIYNGKNILPNEYSKKEGMIFDSLGKAVDIQLNFNGRYSIVRHSCGTGCSYITLTYQMAVKTVQYFQITAYQKQAV